MASGADTRSGINLFSDALSLDLSSGAWQRLEFDKTPEARWRATLSYDAIENKGYLFGGWQDFGGDEALNELWVLDLGTLQWNQFQ